jgi:hypothetical protein
VLVVVVVPAHKIPDPGAGSLEIHEGAIREAGSILERSKEGFWEGIVVADVGTAE